MTENVMFQDDCGQVGMDINKMVMLMKLSI